MLATKNSHKRDTRVRFESEGHRYYIDGSTTGYVSATTWLGSFSEKFDADVVIEKYYDKWQCDPKNAKYFGKSREEIKRSWSKKGEAACLMGTALHESIEDVFNDRKPQNFPDTIAPEWEAFGRFRTEVMEDGLLKPFRTEMIVFDESAKLAGSVDFLAQCENGDLVIFDWKRSTQDLSPTATAFGGKTLKRPFQTLPDTVFYKYSLQLNLYRVLLEDQTLYDFRVKDARLVQMHADSVNADGQVELKIIAVPDLRELVREALAIRRRSL